MQILDNKAPGLRLHLLVLKSSPKVPTPLWVRARYKGLQLTTPFLQSWPLTLPTPSFPFPDGEIPRHPPPPCLPRNCVWRKTWSRKNDETTPDPLPSPPADKRRERKRRGQAGPHQAPPPFCASAHSPPPPHREQLLGHPPVARALPRSGCDPRLERPRGWPPTRPGPGRTGRQRRGRGGGEARVSARGLSTDLRKPEENAGGLDELAAQDAQVRLAGQVEPVLHGRGGREPLLRNQRVIDGERNFRVETVADQDPSRRGRRRGRRAGAWAARARGSRWDGGGSGRGRVRPGRHSLSELHARPTQPEPGVRLTSVLGATDIPVTAGFWPLHAACASALTSPRPAGVPTIPFRRCLRPRSLRPRRPVSGVLWVGPSVTWVTSPLVP